MQESSSECWLIADKNLRISLVLSVLPAPLSPLKEEEEGSVCTVPAASGKALCLASPPNHKLLEVRKTEVIRNYTKTAAEYPFKLVEYDIRQKIQAIFRHHATVQTAFQGTDYIRMNNTYEAMKSVLNTTAIKQFSPAWNNKVRTMAWQWLGRKSIT